MSNFKNLVDKVISEAESKKEEILNNARKEAGLLVDKKVDEAHLYKEQLINKAHVDGKEIKEKMISKCELNIRNKKLEAKRKVLDDIFLKAKSELFDLKEDLFKQYLIKNIPSFSLEGEYLLIVPIKYLNLGNDFLNELNKYIDNKFRIKEIRPSDSLKGGFILEKDGVFINYSFDSIVDKIREDIEFEISNLLFN